jgi:hypothetical protein
MYITEKKLIKWALYSNIIYVLLLVLFKPNGINIEKIIITSFLLFSVSSLLFICYINRKKLKEIPTLIRLLFYGLIFYSLIVIVRGFSLSMQDWVTNFGNVYMGLAWATPIVLILGLKIENWNVVFKAIHFMFQLMIIVFFMTIFFIDDYIKWAWLLRPVNFILLVAFYKYGLLNKIKVYIIIGIYILIAIWVQQRMDLLFLSLTLGFLVMDKLITVKIKKLFLKYILFGFVVVFTLIFTVGYEHVSSIIASMIEFEDSRTFLYTELFEELAKTNDKLLGRGSLGTYYSDFFERTRRYYILMGEKGWAGDDPNRITTEVGYLQMILKGGFVMLFLNSSIAFYSSYLAVFKSKSKFIKRLGFYILILSILSVVSFRPAFTPTFILFWIAIGTVLIKRHRDMTDDEINSILKFK